MSRSRRARLVPRSVQAPCTARVVAPTPPPLFMKVMTFPDMASSRSDVAHSSRPVRVTGFGGDRERVDEKKSVGIGDRHLTAARARSRIGIVQVEIAGLP